MSPSQDPGDTNLDSEPLEQDLVATPGGEKDGSDEPELSNTLENKLRLRHKLLKVSHHLTFLEKCTNQDVVPKGLRIQQELYYMDASVNSSTRTNIGNILKRSERMFASPDRAL